MIRINTLWGDITDISTTTNTLSVNLKEAPMVQAEVGAMMDDEPQADDELDAYMTGMKGAEQEQQLAALRSDLALLDAQIEQAQRLLSIADPSASCRLGSPAFVAALAARDAGAAVSEPTISSTPMTATPSASQGSDIDVACAVSGGATGDIDSTTEAGSVQAAGSSGDRPAVLRTLGAVRASPADLKAAMAAQDASEKRAAAEQAFLRDLELLNHAGKGTRDRDV